jgi:hypothetical protein
MTSHAHDPASKASSLSPHALGLVEEEVARPVSPERRARMQRIVKGTVAACVALCLAAVVRVGASHAMAGNEGAAAPAPAALPSTTIAATTVVTPPPATQAAPDATPVSAVAEREAARRSLEAGKAKEAAAAAARATAADPSEAEAWLILGAADQRLGKAGAAREAFRACVKSAKRGPVKECRAMARR